MSPVKYRILNLKYLELFIPVVFWIIVLASPILFRNTDEKLNWDHILSVWISFLPFIALYLLNRFVFLPYFFFRSSRLMFFISNIVLIFAMATLVQVVRPGFLSPLPDRSNIESGELPLDSPPGYIPPGERPQGHIAPGDLPPGELPPKHKPPGPENRPGRNTPPIQLPPFISFIVVSILIVGFDTGLVVSVKWAQSEQKRIQAEKENTESQLALLQNQVSPHFFMNTLNNIHSLIDIDAEEAKDSIIKLSKLMRHLLYDSQADSIPLSKEFEFIMSYVELMKLRYSDKVSISLNLPKTVSDRSVPPLLFTSFVENAFKHGISYQTSSYIDISFFFEDDKLCLTIRNSIPDKMLEEGHSGGIGIENSRLRLDLIYGDSYTLDIDDTKEEFTVRLKIPI